jgi:LysM repeat protein
MFNKTFIFSVLFVMFSVKALAFTGDEKRYLKYGDTLTVFLNDFQEKIFTHQLAEKQTLFSLAKFYGLKINELYYYNPEFVKTAPKAGQAVKIPIPNRCIIRERDKKFNAKNNIPLMYVAKQGENLKKIAEMYFNMPIDTLKKRNKLSDDNIKVGQKFHIGWISAEGIQEEQRKIKGAAILQIMQNYKTTHQAESVAKKAVTKRGVAFWQKESKMGSGLYALHRDCAENTIVMVNNPMKNKTVYVKVIGKIPPGTQDDNVEIVISPHAAKLLGALDSKFFVNVKYYK